MSAPIAKSAVRIMAGYIMAPRTCLPISRSFLMLAKSLGEWLSFHHRLVKILNNLSHLWVGRLLRKRLKRARQRKACRNHHRKMEREKHIVYKAYGFDPIRRVPHIYTRRKKPAYSFFFFCVNQKKPLALECL